MVDREDPTAAFRVNDFFLTMGGDPSAARVAVHVVLNSVRTGVCVYTHLYVILYHPATALVYCAFA
jgi:hypothetical protein